MTNAQDLRPITKDEWDKYEWIQVSSQIYIRGVEKTAPPEEPQDNNAHELIDITTFRDDKRVYKWVTRMTPK